MGISVLIKGLNKTIDFPSDTPMEAIEQSIKGNWSDVEKMSGLPMDQASRMERAKYLGFDVDRPLFHGSGAEVESFDSSKLGSNTSATDAREGHFFATNPNTASSPIYAKPSKENIDRHLTGKYGGNSALGINVVRGVDEKISSLVNKVSDIQSRASLKMHGLTRSNEKYKQWKKETGGDRKELTKRFLSGKDLTQQELDIFKSNGDLDILEKLFIDDTGYTGDNPYQGFKDRMAIIDRELIESTHDLEMINAYKGAGDSFANVSKNFSEVKDPLIKDMKGGNYSEAEYANAIQTAKSEGRGGVIFTNVVDGAGQISDVDVIFDPKNIRSVNAEFNPANKESGNLLGGLAAGAVGVGAMGASEESEASIMDRILPDKVALDFYKAAEGSTLGSMDFGDIKGALDVVASIGSGLLGAAVGGATSIMGGGPLGQSVEESFNRPLATEEGKQALNKLTKLLGPTESVHKFLVDMAGEEAEEFANKADVRLGAPAKEGARFLIDLLSPI